MIDLHCQLLDGIGRDPGGFDLALEICRRARAEGVQTIVATRLLNQAQEQTPVQLAADRQTLERLNREMGGTLSFKLGFVLKFHSDLPGLLDQHGTALTLAGGRCVLIALPSLHTPPEAEEVWQEVSARGFNLILARPECSLALRRNLARLDRWVKEGVLLQLDAASVTGLHGREVQAFALHCAQRYEGRVVVASHARVGYSRQSSLGLAREELVRKSGPQLAHMLLSETPAFVIKEESGEPCAEDAGRPRPSIISRLRSIRLQKGFSNAS